MLRLDFFLSGAQIFVDFIGCFEEGCKSRRIGDLLCRCSICCFCIQLLLFRLFLFEFFLKLLLALLVSLHHDLENSHASKYELVGRHKNQVEDNGETIFQLVDAIVTVVGKREFWLLTHKIGGELIIFIDIHDLVDLRQVPS